MSSPNDDPCDRLSPEALAKLREAVLSVHKADGGPVPHADLLALAQSALPSSTLTVDFRSADELGLPLVILQVDRRLTEDERLSALSPRERAVAALIAAGLSNKEIAGRLQIAVATVKDHVHRILVKTGLPNRAAVAALLVGGLS